MIENCYPNDIGQHRITLPSKTTQIHQTGRTTFALALALFLIPLHPMEL